MFCIKCGTPLPDDANFCLKCGCDLRNLNQRTGTSYSSVTQNNGDVKEPIEWLVLEVNSNEALLISRYCLDRRQYHPDWIDMTWEDCDLRRWLNDDFLKDAFSPEEQSMIKLSEIVNDNNRECGTCGGNNTQDRVFCLSFAEAELYFKNIGERQCQPTAHARNQGARVDDGNGCCSWWLRSPGLDQTYASGVYSSGALGPLGARVSGVSVAVRPALRLILNL